MIVIFDRRVMTMKAHRHEHRPPVDLRPSDGAGADAPQGDAFQPSRPADVVPLDSHVWLHLSPREQCLYRGDRRTPLTPRAFALLMYLVERPNDVVAPQELLRSAWPGRVVEDGQVKQFICALRALLRDDPAAPRFIETVRGCGYRYLGGIGIRHGACGAIADSANGAATTASGDGAGALAGLGEGRRVLCIIQADPARAERWLKEQSASQHLSGGWWTLHARGAEICRDEAYSPFLDGLDTLCVGPDETFFVAALRRWAPTWALQLPWRFSSAEIEAMQPLCAAGAEGRSRREFARLLEAMAARRPLVLRVDDLHQIDAASRRLLDYLLMQPLPARLCILVTTPSREDADQLERAAMRFSAYSVLRPV